MIHPPPALSYFRVFTRTSLAVILGLVAWFLANAIFPSLTLNHLHQFAQLPEIPPEVKPLLADAIVQVEQMNRDHHVIGIFYLSVAALHAIGTLPIWFSYRRQPKFWKGACLHINNTLTLTTLPWCLLWEAAYILFIYWFKSRDRKPVRPPVVASRANTQSAFTLVELMGAMSVMLIITLAITSAHRFTRTETDNVRALDRITALNQAERDLVDYVNDTAPNKPGSDQPASDSDYASTAPSIRATFLLRHQFLARPIDTTGLSLTIQQNRNFWLSP